MTEAPAREAQYIVSPFMHELPEDFVLSLLRRPMGNRALHAALVMASPFSSRVRRALRDQRELRRRIAEHTISLLMDPAHPEGLKLIAISPEDKRWCEQARLNPSKVGELQAQHPKKWSAWIQAGLFLKEESAFTRHSYQRIELEIVRHCNYRCTFCPVARHPKPKALMSDEVYRQVLQRAVEYGAKAISLNHYSEPTLDPNLLSRLRLAKELGLRVDLNTNASLLSEDKIREMARLGNTELLVNLPSVDREEYQRLTGSKLVDRVIENLRLAHRHGLKVVLSINSPRNSGDDAVRKINNAFSKMFGDQIRWRTDDRAGLLDNSEFVDAVNHAGRLSGCQLSQRQLNVSWEGKAFLCCQDFHQEYILGDLRQQSIREIDRSERAIQIRRWIFGQSTPPDGFICSRCHWTNSLESEGLGLRAGSAESMRPPRDLDPRLLLFAPPTWV